MENLEHSKGSAQRGCKIRASGRRGERRYLVYLSGVAGCRSLESLLLGGEVWVGYMATGSAQEFVAGSVGLGVDSGGFRQLLQHPPPAVPSSFCTSRRSFRSD